MDLEEEHRRAKEYWDRMASKRAQAPPLFRFQHYFHDRYRAQLREPILDVGCGDGEMLERLAKEGMKEVYGIDISEVAVGLARDRLRPYLGDRVEGNIRVGDMLHLSRYYELGFFGTLFCEGTFHQTTYCGAGLISKEMSQVVSKGGLVYLSVRSDSTPPKNASLVEGEEGTYRLGDEGGVVRCYFSKKGIVGLVQERFDVLEIQERELITKVGREPYNMWIMVLRRR